MTTKAYTIATHRVVVTGKARDAGDVLEVPGVLEHSEVEAILIVPRGHRPPEVGEVVEATRDDRYDRGGEVS